MTSREKFEQFIIDRDGAIWVTVLGESRNYNEPIERDFETWQASRESLVVELPSSGTVVGKAYVAHCRQSIEAAGIKVKP